MKKNIVCIFAHPDDEAFGPGGTIAKLAKEYNVYILCATRGQAGQDATPSEKKLAHRRAEELKESAKILGVKKVYFLGFRDGYLSNALYHKIADKIQAKIEQLKPEEVMTFNFNGGSGHLDHIAVAYITTYLFHKNNFINKILYWCPQEKEAAELAKDYFIYTPKGCKKTDADLVVDIKDVWDTKVEAMKQHSSQTQDVQLLLRIKTPLPKEEYFFITKK